MPSNLTVEWSANSLQNAIEISNWIRRKFSENEVEKFKKLLIDFEKIITQFPKMFPNSTVKSEIYQAVVHKNLSIYYALQNNQVVVLALRDNRQKKIL